MRGMILPLPTKSSKYPTHLQQFREANGVPGKLAGKSLRRIWKSLKLLLKPLIIISTERTTICIYATYLTTIKTQNHLLLQFKVGSPYRWVLLISSFLKTPYNAKWFLGRFGTNTKSIIIWAVLANLDNVTQRRAISNEISIKHKCFCIIISTSGQKFTLHNSNSSWIF